METSGSEIEGKNKPRYFLAILLALLLGACTGQNAPATLSSLPPTATSDPPTLLQLQADYWPTEGWRTSTPEEQGIDSEQLAELMDYLQGPTGFTIHILLILRNGYIVTDAYFYPFAESSLHDLDSATKSFTSTLVGISIDQGNIESVGQPVLGFFPERTAANLDANKESLTLEDLLTMRSGFQCSGESIIRQMIASPDWSQFALDLPMATETGTRYAYCSLNSHLLSAIIQESTGMSALAFAQKHLFGPLGVSDVIWPADPQGNNWGWGDMKLAPHDMAKLGTLFLNEGLWDGKQVVSAAWVKAATSGGNYGYQWWLKPSGLDFATGVGGQEIWVLPDQDMVVVTTGASGGGGSGAWGDQLMRSHIIPLAESAAPLPPNPDGVATLATKIRDAAEPVQIQPEPVPPMPEIAQQVDEFIYVFDDNPVGFSSFALSFPANDEALLKVTTLGSGAEGEPPFEWLIGLDNVERITPGRFGMLSATKGLWESDNVSVVHINEIANRGSKYRVSLAFEDDQATIGQRADNTLQGTLAGRVEE